MDSTPNLKQAGPRDVLTADQALEKIYEQITRADKQPSEGQHDSVPHPSIPQIPVDTFRPATSREGRARRGAVALVLATSVGVTAIASQSSYWDTAKLIFARWVPWLIPTSSQLPEKSGLPQQPGPSTVQTGAAEPTPAQPPTQAQTTPPGVATGAALVQAELAPLLEALANMEQGIEQLKVTQAQMARDNAQIAEHLRAIQEQMASTIAKASGHDPRPKTSAAPAQPGATSTSKPVRTPPLPQGTTRTQAQSTRQQAP